MSDYDEYEKKAKEIREMNDGYLDGFKKYLQGLGLKEKTIKDHLANVDFYINNYLLYYDALEAEQGCYEVDGFLGNWFIRKAMWSTVSSIKSNIASFKKFYKYFLDLGIIEEDDYDDLCETIKLNKEDWFDTVTRYNDPDEENPFFY